MKSLNSRLYNFDFLRVLFTIFIVIHHILGRYGVFSLASASVEFFFILSGFFLTYTIKNQKDCVNFIAKKIIRFWPLICFSTFCMFLISKNSTLEGVLAPLFFLPATGLFDDFVGSIAIWYICVLFWLSIFYFYFIKYFNRHLVNICIGILTFYNYIICIKYGWKIFETINNVKIFTIGMSRGIAGMGCGYFIAILYEKYATLFCEKKTSLKYSIFEIFIFLYILIAMFLYTPSNRIFLVISFILLIWLFLIKKGFVSKYFNDADYQKISQYCLSIFLTHNIVIAFLIPHISTYIENKTLQMIFIFITSLLFGVFAHHVVEKPALKYLQTKISFY